MLSTEFDIEGQKARQRKWDLDFLVDAILETRRSKDPSTKVGAIVARPDGTTAARGYNGFPRGVHDTPERLNDRSQKYPRVVHAEANAIVTAREPLHGYTLYCTHVPCSDGHNCAGLVIQSGIRRVVALDPVGDAPGQTGGLPSSWRASLDTSAEMFSEAGVSLDFYPKSDVIARMEEQGIILRDVTFLRPHGSCCAIDT